jgi:hypothetical protein
MNVLRLEVAVRVLSRMASLSIVAAAVSCGGTEGEGVRPAGIIETATVLVSPGVHGVRERWWRPLGLRNWANL